MNGITNLHGMNMKHEETNCCALGYKRMHFIYARSGLRLLHAQYVR